MHKSLFERLREGMKELAVNAHVENASFVRDTLSAITFLALVAVYYQIAFGSQLSQAVTMLMSQAESFPSGNFLYGVWGMILALAMFVPPLAAIYIFCSFSVSVYRRFFSGLHLLHLSLRILFAGIATIGMVIFVATITVSVSLQSQEHIATNRDWIGQLLMQLFVGDHQ